MSGLELTQDEAVRITRKHFPWFEYCLVRDWVWIDLDVTRDQREGLGCLGSDSGKRKNGRGGSFP